jgi:hypothetical protein
MSTQVVTDNLTGIESGPKRNLRQTSTMVFSSGLDFLDVNPLSPKIDMQPKMTKIEEFDEDLNVEHSC